MQRTRLVPSMDKDALLSALTARGAIDTTRSDEPPSMEGDIGVLYTFSMTLAWRDDINETIREPQPPEKSPVLSHGQASDLHMPRSYAEARGSENANLWSDSMGRDFYGLLGAGTSHET